MIKVNTHEGVVKLRAKKVRQIPLTVGKLKKLLEGYDDNVKVGVKSEPFVKSKFPRTIVLCQYGEKDAEIKLMGFRWEEDKKWG